MPFPKRLRGACLFFSLAMALPMATPAQADGLFFQLDYAPKASSAVLSVQRKAVGLSLGWSEWDTGEATTLFANYALPLAALGGGTTLKFGPALRHEAGTATTAGLRVALENYRQTDLGGLFLLADVNSINREYLLLAEWGLRDNPLSIAVSFQGDDGTFHEETLALGYQLPNSDMRLRVGHRFEESTSFIGFAINTF